LEKINKTIGGIKMNYNQRNQYGANQGTGLDLGAHEALEVHEVLTDSINGINLFHLYRPHIQDEQLMQVADRQVTFLEQEYNGMVNLLNQRGMQQAVPYRALKTASPKYGLHNPAPERPSTTINDLDDRDVSSAMLCHHKASASMKMKGSLECADPELRKALVQGSINCNEMAYETWSYMNQKGYYQVPTMKDVTTSNVLNTYQPATAHTHMTGTNTSHQTPYNAADTTIQQ
jgi:spore coat protein CotF